eukprot:4681619-Amphidinium_carterae.1
MIGSRVRWAQELNGVKGLSWAKHETWVGSRVKLGNGLRGVKCQVGSSVKLGQGSSCVQPQPDTLRGQGRILPS